MHIDRCLVNIAKLLKFLYVILDCGDIYKATNHVTYLLHR